MAAPTRSTVNNSILISIPFLNFSAGATGWPAVIIMTTLPVTMFFLIGICARDTALLEQNTVILQAVNQNLLDITKVCCKCIFDK